MCASHPFFAPPKRLSVWCSIAIRHRLTVFWIILTRFEINFNVSVFNFTGYIIIATGTFLGGPGGSQMPIFNASLPNSGFTLWPFWILLQVIHLIMNVKTFGAFRSGSVTVSSVRLCHCPSQFSNVSELSSFGTKRWLCWCCACADCSQIVTDDCLGVCPPPPPLPPCLPVAVAVTVIYILARSLSVPASPSLLLDARDSFFCSLASCSLLVWRSVHLWC